MSSLSTPADCDELVQVLVDASEQTIRHLDGFVSANIHRSNEGKRVINYAQWLDLEAFTRHAPRPKDKSPHGQAASLAESFDPIICGVIDTCP